LPELYPLGRRESVRDQRIERLEALLSPRGLLEELPLTDEHVAVVLRAREQIHAILDGEDDRLLVVVGPCSVHDVQATLDYARRLSSHAAGWGEDLLLAMRVYFEKPRTTTGWKGLINDPHLDDSGDVNSGLRLARRLPQSGRSSCSMRVRVPPGFGGSERPPLPPRRTRRRGAPDPRSGAA